MTAFVKEVWPKIIVGVVLFLLGGAGGSGLQTMVLADKINDLAVDITQIRSQMLTKEERDEFKRISNLTQNILELPTMNVTSGIKTTVEIQRQRLDLMSTRLENVESRTAASLKDISNTLNQIDRKLP